MNRLLVYWQAILLAVILFITFAEICLRALRIGRFHPEIKDCRWTQVPWIAWRAMTENRFYLFELLRRITLRHARRIGDHPKGPLIFMLVLGLSLYAIGTSHAAQGPPTALRTGLVLVAPPERLGPVWPILEPDIRTVIQERLAARLPEIRTRLKESLKTYRIPPTEKPTTETARTLYIDPSITLTANLTSHDGRVLAPSGRRINPLTILPLRRTYLVINGTDSRQVDWVKQQITAHPRAPVTVLLTDGSLEMMRDTLPTSARLFPAPPALFARLPIDSVPARIGRRGERLQIDLVAEAEFRQ